MGYFSKLLFHHQHVENKVYKDINNILANQGYDFKIEKYIDSNSIQTLNNWDKTKAKFPFKRNKAFYLMARAMEESNHFESNSNYNLFQALQMRPGISHI